MAILLPALHRARNQARAVVCQANLKQWGTTFAVYIEENNGHIPKYSGDLLWFLRGTYIYEGDPNNPLIQQDINTKGIACCPMATKSGDGLGTFGASASMGIYSYDMEGTTGSTFRAWEIIQPLPKFRGSYGFNGELINKFPSLSEISNPNVRRISDINIYSLKNRTEIPLFLDSITYHGSMTRILNRIIEPPITELSYHDFCINRHYGHVNGLFLDWSVRKIGLKQLWKLRWNEDFDRANQWTIAGGVQPENWPEWMWGFKDY
jgi:prepilin-type processing-associated H-X9-DG protein